MRHSSQTSSTVCGRTIIAKYNIYFHLLGVPSANSLVFNENWQRFAFKFQLLVTIKKVIEENQEVTIVNIFSCHTIHFFFF